MLKKYDIFGQPCLGGEEVSLYQPILATLTVGGCKEPELIANGSLSFTKEEDKPAGDVLSLPSLVLTSYASHVGLQTRIACIVVVSLSIGVG